MHQNPNTSQMETQLEMEKLGETLVKYIKEESPYTLAEVASRTLGITYSNFQKRLSRNNIKIYELQQILDFLQLEITISLGNMSFQSKPNSPVNYEEMLAQKDRVLRLQDKIIQLQEELNDYRRKGIP